MALIDIIVGIPYTSSETVNVIRKETFTKPNGAEGYIENDLGDFKVNIQPMGTLNKIEGLTLRSELTGNGIDEVWGMYSHNYGFKMGDIVTRSSDGLKYEIKSAEINGLGTPLEFSKCLIVKVDNQEE
jgi:hypothetical protein